MISIEKTRREGCDTANKQRASETEKGRKSKAEVKYSRSNPRVLLEKIMKRKRVARRRYTGGREKGESGNERHRARGCRNGPRRRASLLYICCGDTNRKHGKRVVKGRGDVEEGEGEQKDREEAERSARGHDVAFLRRKR